ncbi:hypothetical protein [Methylorubrum sp. POS3]|uniref:hypothetical protein n=1 Tax=Methylorubrum sp. POS3 TaxID=2998492 RepID=UPI00372AE295
MSRRILDWRQALSDLRADRAPRPDIREERLGTQSTAAVRLSCWRGQSGRRYVVTVQPLDTSPIALSSATDPRLLVALAVRRTAGVASIVAVSGIEAVEERQADVVREGATELHVYRLADTPAEHFAAIEDLREAPSADRCLGVS